MLNDLYLLGALIPLLCINSVGHSFVVRANFVVEELPDLIAYSTKMEQEYDSGFACQITFEDGGESTFHRYPNGSALLVKNVTPKDTTIMIVEKERDFIVKRSNLESSDAPWEIVYIGEKHPARDARIFQVERVVKSPWSVWGTPIHELLTNANISVKKSTNFAENSVVLEFKRTDGEEVDLFARRPFFTNHELLIINFDLGNNSRITNMEKRLVEANRLLANRISYDSDGGFVCTDEQGARIAVRRLSKDWADRSELQLSTYGLSKIEQAINQKSRSPLPLLLVLVAAGATLLFLGYIIRYRKRD
jgi:hypothetical protein